MRLTPILCALLCALILTGCGRRPPEPAGDLAMARTLAPVTVFAPNFGDDDPHGWTGRSPASYAVHGIDLSRWQTQVDWPTARANGVNFAFIKATEGGDLRDPLFHSHRQAAAAAGVPHAAYHFFYWCTPAEVQARWFIANVPREPGGLPPILDVEWNAHSPTCTSRPPPEAVKAEMAVFLTLLTQHYGQRPVIYTTPDFWADNGLASLRGEEFWLRSTADHPSQRYPGMPWVFWQYSGTGRIPGIAGPVDLNAFAGTEADWQRWLAARRG
jgi:lysozyme